MYVSNQQLSLRAMLSSSSLLNLQPPTILSFFTTPNNERLFPFQSLKFSRNYSDGPLGSSSSSSVQFSLHHRPQELSGDDEDGDDEEELVIGDCLVFEEGIFEDPFLQQNLGSSPNKVVQSSKSKSKSKPSVEIEPENLIPEKWKEAQVEINITKKERRKMAQQMEFGRRLERRKQRLRPIEIEEYRALKMSQLRPLVLENPEFLVEKEDVKVETGISRVAPRNPKLAVYGANLDDVSKFLNSGNYDPDAAKKPEGSRKLFTQEERVLMNRRVPDLAAATSGKWQPLHTLAASGEFYLVNALLKHDADINVPDKDGLTALHKAILGKKQAIFNYLLRESANPFVRDKDGSTLMHYAVRTASSQMIKILLLYNVDINLQDNDGWTPLHLAVQSRRTDIVRLLLIKGADKTLKNQDGLTPLDLCLYSGRDIRTYELIRLIIQLPRPRKGTEL